MTDYNSDREIGRLDGVVSQLQVQLQEAHGRFYTRLDKIDERFSDVDSKLDTVVTMLAEHKGASVGAGTVARWGLSVATFLSGWIFSFMHISR